MPAFSYEWKDFKGGYFVGPSETTQPANTWKGENVTIANDDAYLVPTYEPEDLTLTGTGVTAGVIDNGTTETVWSPPTYFKNWIVMTSSTGTSSGKCHFINTTTGAVTSATITVQPYDPLPAPVVRNIAGIGGTAIEACCATGSSALSFVRSDTLGVVSIAPGGGTNTLPLTGAAFWNARLVVWSRVSEIVYFSEALDFDNFPSLNYFGVGYNEDGVSYVVPRNLDMIIVKPSGWYSLTGVLGSNASIRQMNDTMGIMYDDPVAQHNNTVYFMANTGFNDYSVNLMAISGTRVDVAAYHRFGLLESKTKIAKTNMGYLSVTTTDFENGDPVATIYLLNALDRWQIMKLRNTSTNQQNTTYSVARGEVSRYGVAADQYLYLVETNSGSSYNTAKVIRVRPNTVEPGKEAGADTPYAGVVQLSDLDSKQPTIIRQIYVEAEIMQFPTWSSPYTGNATMEVRVNNKSVEDITYSTAIGDATSGYSQAYSFPFTDFVSLNTDFKKQVRVLRFNMDNASYGYINEIEIRFAGFRIRRVWVEGDTR